MPAIRSFFRVRAYGVRGRVVAASVVMLLTTGCDERDRLTFPSPSDGVGPVTLIDLPHSGDTTVNEGGLFVVNGRTIDPDGVQTVHFLVTGGSQGFQPFHPSPPTDTVRFGLPLATIGFSGDTLELEIYGVDTEGNQGPSAIRRIAVQ